MINKNLMFYNSKNSIVFIKMSHEKEGDDTNTINKLDSISVESPNKQNEINTSLKKSIKLEQKQKSPSLQFVKQNQPLVSNQPLYQQTYYLTDLRQNFLVLLSDSMHIIELPVGLLKSNVSIGDPIKLKLQFDTKRGALDRKKFNLVEQNLLKQFCKEQK